MGPGQVRGPGERSGLGVLLWALGEDGSKRADLGSALVSTGLFGILLIVFERALAGHTRQVERTVELAAAPEPSVDRPSAQREETEHDGTRMAHTSESAGAKRRYRVESDGWIRAGSRIDAEELRLRVFADDEYFQFFTGIVPGIDFRVAIHGPTNITLAQFRRAITDLTVELLRREVADGRAPLDDPTIAIELFPDTYEAARQARYVDDRDYQEDEEVASWVA